MIQCGIYVHNINSSYYVAIFSRNKFNIYKTCLPWSNTYTAVQLSWDRGRHGLQLHMFFVVYMNEGSLVSDAR